MIRKVQVFLVVLCILSLMAGTALAQGKADPNRRLKTRTAVATALALGQPSLIHPPLNTKAVSAPIPITTQLGYQASLQLGGLYYPSGIGVSWRGDTILFAQDEGSGNVYWHHDHIIDAIPTPTSYLHAARERGAFYVGSYYGEVYKVVDRQYVSLRGWDEYGDDIAALDVDLATGTVYFTTNYYDGGYGEYWTGLYALPKNTSSAILMDWWWDEPCWGIAVKGNFLYITDYYNDSIWKYPKQVQYGPWLEFVFGLDGPTDICFDKLGNMFVAEWGGGSIARVKAGSYNIVRIASGLISPYYLQLDGSDNIYFTDYDMGAIWKLKK